MTNNLTNGMSRLSEEISALRHNRAALTSDLVLERANLENSVAEMMAGFQRDREEMGERTKAELGESRADLENTVSGLIAGFQRDREEMGEKTKSELDEARVNLENTISEMTAGFQRDREEMGEKTKAEVGEFVSNVKDAVASLRQNVADLRAKFSSDIIGGRTAWSGPATERTPNQRGS